MLLDIIKKSRSDFSNHMDFNQLHVAYTCKVAIIFD